MCMVKIYSCKTIYIIKQDIRIHIYVVYSRPNGWTDWAEIFVAGGCYRLKKMKKFSRATLDHSASFIYICNKSRSRDYSALSLILVSLTLSLAKL